MYSGMVGGSAGAVAALEDAAAALGDRPVPAPPAAALEESDRLLRVADVIALAVDQRVGVVDATGQAKVAGHSSTVAWLRNGSLPGQDDSTALAGGRMAAGGAARHRRNGREFARLPETVAALRDGRISHAMASAIATAVSVLTADEDAATAEKILLRLAADPTSTVEKVTRAGRYLRQVLDPDGHLSEYERAHRRRHLSAHLEDDGGMSGTYYLPPEAAARLRALFDAYARKTDSADERLRSQRNADVLIQLLTNAVAAELLVIVNAETLTDGDSNLDGGSAPPPADRPPRRRPGPPVRIQP